MAKIIKEGNEGLIKGVNKIADVVLKTLGPKGKAIAIQTPYGSPDITRDGISVAKSIELKDPIENMGAQLVKEASKRTEDSAGDGPQPLYSKVLTPSGWKLMGDIKVGDIICGTDGSIQTVLGIFLKGKKKIYKVHFSDGQSVECSSDHLWTVTDRYKKTKTLPLSVIMEKGLFYRNPNDNIVHYNFYVPNTKVNFNKKNLIIDPYLVGLLLGDGSLCTSGSITLSIGYKKLHIIKKLCLPPNITFYTKEMINKNYIKVIFKKINRDGPSMFYYLNKIGLLNVKCKDKFIPEDYIFSDIEDRERLLSGLLDTDGYINKDGRFTFSTSSYNLFKDFVELTRSLGYQVRFDSVNKSGYKEDSINYRVHQKKGYINGIKIIGIEDTGKFEETKCIKVSNKDNLYITNDYILTHNTSTTTLLIKELVNKGHSLRDRIKNINEVRTGMKLASKYISDFIIKNSIPVNGDIEKVRRVATISANNDPFVGDLICQAFEEVGFEGVVTADKATGLETTVEITKGFKVPKGWASPNFITNQGDGTCVLDNPLIMVCSENISSVPQVLNILEYSVKSGSPLLIICDSISDSVLVAILANVLNGALRCCVVAGPEFGDSRKNIMQDLATSTGATFICQEYGLKASEATPEMLGTARKVVVSKDSCIVFEGAGDEEEITARLDILKQRLADPELSDYDKTKLQTRVAGLGGGIGVIKIGGSSITDIDNLKATVEDAILASKSTIEEGAAIGGGYTLLQASKIDYSAENLSADEKLGVEIVLSSLPVIMKTIAENSGLSGEVMIDKVEREGKKNYGYNAKTGEFGDLLEMGVLDSAKALRVSIENAVGAASMILLTDSVIYDEPEEKK